MKNTKVFLIISAFLILCAYSTYTTICIQRLENRLHQQKVDRANGPTITYGFDAPRSEATYVFNDSFRHYFGENGVAAVERAFEIIGQHPIVITPDPNGYNIDFDFLANPLRVDER